MFIHWNQSSVVAAEISWSKQFYDDDGEKLLHNPRPTLKHCKAQEHTDWISWFKPAVPKEIYDHLHKSFYPAMYNADSIVHTAMQAGVKYIVMVTKHHDGFCMWDSEYTDYDIMSTPFARDIVGEMADACHRHGMKFCIYYSQRDWHHPDYSSENLPRYNLYMRNQIKELLTKYAPVAGIFFDAHAWNKDPEVWESETLFKEIYAIAPDILINNRCGVPGDYYTPEQRVGSIDMETMWESCMTFTGEWSWRGFANEVIPVEKCFDYLINCAGGNGNLLLNIDPLPTGQIDPREKSRLKIMGEWLARNGEAIYGSGVWRLYGEGSERRSHLRHTGRFSQTGRLGRLYSEGKEPLSACQGLELVSGITTYYRIENKRDNRRRQSHRFQGREKRGRTFGTRIV